MIIPALDLIDSKVVRLYQGNYNHATNYDITPQKQFDHYAQAGSEWLHLVDLAGAKDTSKRQLDTISKLLQQSSACIQVGGGIRTTQDVERLFEVGAKRIVVSSIALKNPTLVKSWLKTYGALAVVLALDVHIDQYDIAWVMTGGWQDHSGQKVQDVISDFSQVGLRHVLCTDIALDGTLKGSNAMLYTKLCQEFPDIAFQASGGIGTLEDIKALKPTGVSGVIVGRALLEGKFSIEEAIACWQNA